MTQRKMPVEIAGYINCRIWTRDPLNGIDEFKWFSVANENYVEDDFEVWEGDSAVDNCPF